MVASGRLSTARRYHDLGFNLVSQRVSSGDKKPNTVWKGGKDGKGPNWTVNRQTLEDLLALPWANAQGVAAVLGPISGGLCCVDFDHQDRSALDAFVEKLGLPDDYRWIDQTPGGGWHLWLLAPDLVDVVDEDRLFRPGLNGAWREDRPTLPDTKQPIIELRIRNLLATLPPSRHPSGGVYIWINGEPAAPPVQLPGAAILAAYDSLTLAPAPAPERDPRPYAELEVSDDEKQAFRDRLAVEIEHALVKRGRKDGYYECPFGDHRHGKDFLFDVKTGQIGGCQGKHSGQVTKLVDLAALLKIDVTAIAREIRELFRPTPPQSAPDATPEIQPRRFPKGLPYTLNKRLMNLHKKAHINNQHPAALVLFVWQELGEFLPGDQPVTAGKFQEATELAGRWLTRRTVDSGLRQAHAMGFSELICTKCNLPTKTDSRRQVAFCTNPNHRRHAYRFLPVDEQLANFERTYNRLTKENAFATAPDNAQQEYGNLTEEEADALDEARVGSYKTFAEERKQAQDRYMKQREYVGSAVDRIREGRYNPIVLPAGALSNTTAYRDAIHKAGLKASGGVREKAYTAQYEIGVSRSTLSRVRTRNRAITVERTKTVAASEITAYQRDHKLVLTEHADGTATVRAASAEKFVDMADPVERAKYEELCEKQKARRAKALELELPPDGEIELVDEEGPPVIPKSDTVPTDWTEAYLLKQLGYTPGALTCDPETGEILPAKQLWKLTAKKLLAERMERIRRRHETLTRFPVFVAPVGTDRQPPTAEPVNVAIGPGAKRVVPMNPETGEPCTPQELFTRYHQKRQADQLADSASGKTSE